ncbi:hypothetical protein [Streptomyces avicenniae]|uniref:hypothetical protein n=1 Tax=Streptomyces avicenniae TaxID=500153 RepID=UPI000A5B3D81|nr:hypothetical protein [Streptomyces avicenniae]
MGPGEQQHGGGPTPSWPNPYQQPGYQQPNPYQQPPEPYTPPQMPVPGPGAGGGAGWEPPGPPSPPPAGGPGGDGGRRGRRTAVAVVASVAAVAALAVAGVYALGGDDGGREPTADGSGASTPEGTPSDGSSDGPAPERSYAPDDPRQGVPRVPDPVVAPDWQVQTSENRGNAFDVPPDDWQIGAEDRYVGFADDRPDAEEPGAPLVTMTAVATYLDGWCPEADGSSDRAKVGTKGAQGATGTAEAAENEAVNWVLAGYDQAQEGTLDVSEAEPFESDHGLSGHVVRATVTDVPDDPENACGTTDGKAVAFTYVNARNDLATWVVVADAGVPEELADETIDTMMRSLRPYPAE